MKSNRLSSVLFVFGLVLFQLQGRIWAQTLTPVTFQLNMSGTAVSPSGIHLAGEFQGWNPITTQMTDPDGNGVFEVTVQLPQNSTQQFKFINGISWQSVENVPAACQLESGNSNRFIHIPNGSGPLTYSVCWNRCAPCGMKAMRFQVDMTNEPLISSQGVHVTGDFQGWNSGSTPLVDVNGDGVWEAVVALSQSTSSIEFVFINGNSWTNPVENLQGLPCATTGGYRAVGLPEAPEVILMGNPLTGAAPCFDECTDCIPPVPVTFRVDMNAEAEVSPNGIHIAGSFQGWSPATHPLSDGDGDGVWETTLQLNQGVHQFKFINGNNWGGNGSGNIDNELLNGPCTAEGADNRIIVVDASTSVYEACYNTCDVNCLGTTTPFAFDCSSIGDTLWQAQTLGLYPAQLTATVGEPWEGEWVLHVPASLTEPTSGSVFGIYQVEWTSLNGLPEWCDALLLPESSAPSSQLCLPVSGIPDAAGTHTITATGAVFISIFGQPFPIGEQSFSSEIQVIDNPNLILGCTYPLASNFLPYADLEDGSCIFGGCTDPEAGNFNPFANTDDGSCTSPCDGLDSGTCTSDISGDGSVNVQDVLLLLGAFGTECD